LSNPEDPHSALDPTALRQHAEGAGVEQPIQIKSHTIELEEDGVRISLTVVDTPGFGDGIDNEYW
jgi:cell division control protein 11